MFVTRTSKFAAVSTVIIGGDQECRFRVDRFAVERQILNSLGIFVYQRTFAIKARWLRDINLIVHTINDIKVIGAEPIPVDQRLRLAAVYVDLVKLTRRAFEPVL